MILAYGVIGAISAGVVTFFVLLGGVIYGVRRLLESPPDRNEAGDV